MIVSYNKAIEIFSRLPSNVVFPSLHPDYLLADAARDLTLEPTYFVYEDNKQIFYHPFLLGKIPDSDFFDIQSAYGYGGGVSSSNDESFLAKAKNAYITWVNKQNVIVEFIRFHPYISNQLIYWGNIDKNRECVWINLKDRPTFENLENRVRTTIRKAINSNLQVTWSSGLNALNDFSKIYYSTMNDIGANESYFFPSSYFNKLSNIKNLEVCFCHLNEKILGAALFFREAEGVEYHLAGATKEGKTLGAPSLILFEAIQHYSSQNYGWLHLGGGRSRLVDDKLLFFKSGFSKKSCDFYTGFYIWNKEEYQSRKLVFETKNNCKTDRIIFYR